jgi:hypothetical protein
MREVKGVVARLAWSVLLGIAAALVWLLLTPLAQVHAPGQLAEFVRGSSNDALARMWRIQLPSTALASCIFSLLVIKTVRTGYPAWGSGGAVGAAFGRSLALLLFASPLPGALTYIWAATAYATGVPVAMAVEALPAEAQSLAAPIFSAMLPMWPAVVVTVLASVGIMAGGIVGQGLFLHIRGAVEHPVGAGDARR